MTGCRALHPTENRINERSTSSIHLGVRLEPMSREIRPRGIDRRYFLKKAAAAGVGVSMAAITRPVVGADAPNETVVVGVMGTGNRGSSLARGFARLPGAEVAYVCDVDERRVSDAAAEVGEIQNRKPTSVTDFRRILEDADVDALVVATPDHWHAPAAMLALDAGKHVYVEKPGSHNPREGELLVQAAEKHDRVVQMGNQRRSWPIVIEAMDGIRGGLIGEVYYARAWYANDRPATYLQGASSPPSHLDWNLWQGPAPRVDYDASFHPYDWHWFWAWGTGEAGNNAIHALDLCRWGLSVDRPTRVSAHGGRYHYDDDWETPDTHVISLDFEGEKTVVWEGRSRNSRPIEESGFGASFHGTGGTAVIRGGNAYWVYNNDNDLIREVRGYGEGQDAAAGPGFDIDYDHLKNFTEAIRHGVALRSPIREGQKSTMLCHLGNIAYRTNRTLECDPDTGHILNDDEAVSALWGRTYEPGWEPKE